MINPNQRTPTRKPELMSFVSARDLEAARLARKEQQREMREEILREAKESFEKEKKREELKRARGDDTWILPAVKKRLGFKGEPTSSVSEKKKKRKKKEKKKHKSHKASKTEKEQFESESGESGEEGEEEDMWVEKESTGPALSSASMSESQKSRCIHYEECMYVQCTSLAKSGGFPDIFSSKESYQA